MRCALKRRCGLEVDGTSSKPHFATEYASSCPIACLVPVDKDVRHKSDLTKTTDDLGNSDRVLQASSSLVGFLE